MFSACGAQPVSEVSRASQPVSNISKETGPNPSAEFLKAGFSKDSYLTVNMCQVYVEFLVCPHNFESHTQLRHQTPDVVQMVHIHIHMHAPVQ